MVTAVNNNSLWDWVSSDIESVVLRDCDDQVIAIIRLVCKRWKQNSNISELWEKIVMKACSELISAFTTEAIDLRKLPILVVATSLDSAIIEPSNMVASIMRLTFRPGLAIKLASKLDPAIQGVFMIFKRSSSYPLRKKQGKWQTTMVNFQQLKDKIEEKHQPNHTAHTLEYCESCPTICKIKMSNFDIMLKFIEDLVQDKDPYCAIEGFKKPI